GAPNIDAQAAQAKMNRQDRSERGNDVLQHLRGQSETEVVHATAAVLLGEADPRQANLAELGECIRVVVVIDVVVLDGGHEFLGYIVVHGSDEQLLVGGKRKVKH